MRANRIVETCLYGEDLAAMREFYVKLLGREPFTEAEGRHVFFKCGKGVFLIFNPGATEKSGGPIPPHGARGHGHVAFRMNEGEVAAVRQWLEDEVGVEIETNYEWPNGGYSIYFRDPAGNSVEFTTLTTWGLPE